MDIRKQVADEMERLISDLENDPVEDERTRNRLGYAVPRESAEKAGTVLLLDLDDVRVSAVERREGQRTLSLCGD
jgi:hypothetical protein